MISWSELASIGVRRSSTKGLGPVRSQRVACATRERATLGVSARGPFGIRIGAGPCRPSRSVTRREKPGQTRSPCTLCTVPDGRPAGPGDAAPILPPCDPTTHARVSPRDRRDTRPHAHHLLRHPDVRRPAVPGPAAVDGAHAGARPVRPRRQADAPLRRLQARRHRGLHARRPTGSRTTARRSSSGSSASAATRSTSTTATSTSTAPRSTSRTTSTRSPASRAPADHRPGRRAPLGRRRRRPVPDGRPPRQLGGFADLRHRAGRRRSSGAPGSATGRSTCSGSCRRRPTRNCLRRQ